MRGIILASHGWLIFFAHLDLLPVRAFQCGWSKSAIIGNFVCDTINTLCLICGVINISAEGQMIATRSYYNDLSIFSHIVGWVFLVSSLTEVMMYLVLQLLWSHMCAGGLLRGASKFYKLATRHLTELTPRTQHTELPGSSRLRSKAKKSLGNCAFQELSGLGRQHFVCVYVSVISHESAFLKVAKVREI